jgi:Ni/Co efflux regulator RcnB
VQTMIAINRESNHMLFLLSKALQDAQNGDRSRAHAEVNQAVAALDEIQRSESQAEYGKWKNWYRGDWLAGIYRTKQMLEVFSKFLDDPNTHLAPPILWDGWEAYYHIMHYEGDRSADVK